MMTIENRQLNKRRGAALILVIVVTVLLSVIGVMFLMTSRLSEMETASVANSRDLESGVEAVVGKISEVLAANYDAATDYDLEWLCSLEPAYDAVDGIYEWPRITDLWGTIGDLDNDLAFTWVESDDLTNTISTQNVQTKIIAPKDSMGSEETTSGNSNTMSYGARADADGDGVADSRWVKIPDLSTSKGQDIFAAVRIIDNCAMLNLNTACCYYGGTAGSIGEGAWESDGWFYTTTGSQYNPGGRLLSEVNYRPFLRGDDRTTLANSKLIEEARDPSPTLNTPQDIHDELIMNIEELSSVLTPFDLSDELEMRNRFLLTSLTQARFEQVAVAYETFDYERGFFAGGWNVALRSKRTPCQDAGDLDYWHRRLDPFYGNTTNVTTDAFTGDENLDFYDRRHLCTFYSFDRNLRSGTYPLLDSEIGTYAFANYVSAGFASGADYKSYLWDLWGEIFTPEGEVTTNIEDITAAEPYNNIETRKRIVHLLYALREHYLPAGYFTGTPAQQQIDKNTAALKAAQVLANMIDFSDNTSLNTGVAGETQGPFYDPSFTTNGFTIDYGLQANVDSTFLTRAMLGQMLIEVSQDILGAGNEIDYLGNPAVYGDLEFGLEPNPTTPAVATDIVFGYERQPFISEVYVNWSPSPPAAAGTQFDAIAIELVNPYDTPISLIGWTLDIGAGIFTHTFVAAGTGGTPVTNTTAVPAYNVLTGPGRLVINLNPAIIAPPVAVSSYDVPGVNFPLMQQTIVTGGGNIDLLRPAPTIPAAWGFTVVDLVADHVANADLLRVVGGTFPGLNSLKRSDVDWEFIYGLYEAQNSAFGTFTNTLGLSNGGTPPVPIVTAPAIPAGQQFQLAAPDDQFPLARWHDLEILSLFGYDDAAATAPVSIPSKIVTEAALASPVLYHDLVGTSSGLLDYLCTLNRPDLGILPGRINVNTAPAHVIAAAIPPSLVNPVATGYTALDYAQAIVSRRPYAATGGLLTITGVAGQPDFQWYATGTNVGQAGIQGDIEERDWILSHLANKFTVRSDTFTAYILVRLGTDGPQRRMIAIFDRSNVNSSDDRPTLVALHPVPDPR